MAEEIGDNSAVVEDPPIPSPELKSDEEPGVDEAGSNSGKGEIVEGGEEKEDTGGETMAAEKQEEEKGGDIDTVAEEKAPEPAAEEVVEEAEEKGEEKEEVSLAKEEGMGGGDGLVSEVVAEEKSEEDIGSEEKGEPLDEPLDEPLAEPETETEAGAENKSSFEKGEEEKSDEEDAIATPVAPTKITYVKPKPWMTASLRKEMPVPTSSQVTAALDLQAKWASEDEPEPPLRFFEYGDDLPKGKNPSLKQCEELTSALM